jgi:hypothetical protein
VQAINVPDPRSFRSVTHYITAVIYLHICIACRVPQLEAAYPAILQEFLSLRAKGPHFQVRDRAVVLCCAALCCCAAVLQSSCADSTGQHWALCQRMHSFIPSATCCDWLLMHPLPGMC